MTTDAYTSGPVERAAEGVREGLAVAALAVAVCSYAQFAVHARFDAGMTGEVLPVLWSVIPENEREACPARLEEFVDTHRERLARTFAEYGPQSAIAKHGRHELLAVPCCAAGPCCVRRAACSRGCVCAAAGPMAVPRSRRTARAVETAAVAAGAVCEAPGLGRVRPRQWETQPGGRCLRLLVLS